MVMGSLHIRVIPEASASSSSLFGSGAEVAPPKAEKKSVTARPKHAAKEATLSCPWPGCSHVSRQKTNLKVHYLRHTKEQPYTCPHLVPVLAEPGMQVQCDYRTGDPACLTRHRKSQHAYVPKPRGAKFEFIAEPFQIPVHAAGHKEKRKAKESRHHPYARVSKKATMPTTSRASPAEAHVTPTQASTSRVKVEDVAATWALDDDSFTDPTTHNYRAFSPSIEAVPTFPMPSMSEQATCNELVPNYVDCSLYDFASNTWSPEKFLADPTCIDGFFQSPDPSLPSELLPPTPSMISQTPIAEAHSDWTLLLNGVKDLNEPSTTPTLDTSTTAAFPELDNIFVTVDADTYFSLLNPSFVATQADCVPPPTNFNVPIETAPNPSELTYAAFLETLSPTSSTSPPLNTPELFYDTPLFFSPAMTPALLTPGNIPYNYFP